MFYHLPKRLRQVMLNVVRVMAASFQRKKPEFGPLQKLIFFYMWAQTMAFLSLLISTNMQLASCIAIVKMQGFAFWIHINIGILNPQNSTFSPNDISEPNKNVAWLNGKRYTKDVNRPHKKFSTLVNGERWMMNVYRTLRGNRNRPVDRWYLLHQVEPPSSDFYFRSVFTVVKLGKKKAANMPDTKIRHFCDGFTLRLPSSLTAEVSRTSAILDRTIP